MVWVVPMHKAMFSHNDSSFPLLGNPCTPLSHCTHYGHKSGDFPAKGTSSLWYAGYCKAVKWEAMYYTILTSNSKNSRPSSKKSRASSKTVTSSSKNSRASSKTGTSSSKNSRASSKTVTSSSKNSRPSSKTVTSSSKNSRPSSKTVTSSSKTSRASSKTVTQSSKNSKVN